MQHIFCPNTRPWPLGWGKKVKTFFLYVVMLHFKLNFLVIRRHCSTLNVF